MFCAKLGGGEEEEILFFMLALSGSLFCAAALIFCASHGNFACAIALAFFSASLCCAKLGIEGAVAKPRKRSATAFFYCLKEAKPRSSA